MRIGLESTTLLPDTLEAAKPLVREYFAPAVVSAVSSCLHSVPDQPEHSAGNIVQDRRFQDAIISVELMGGGLPVKGWTLGARWLRSDQTENSTLKLLPAQIQMEFNPAQIQAIMEQPAAVREAPETLLVKRAVIALLTQVTGTELPWGVLTGIRPGKLIHYWADKGVKGERRVEALGRRYGVRQDKADLLEEIAAVQESYLQDMQAHPRNVAVYVSIPFCPSRCSYCTFPGQVPRRDRGDVRDYLAALHCEIETVGDMMSRFGLQADSLYLGGGTPTILEAEEIEKLLVDLAIEIPRTTLPELTVEAGRPDTLDPEKLAVLRACGVTRLSVNPQSMHEATLHRVGRTHTVAEVERAFYEAAALSGWVINMDLIIGLPGEGVTEVAESVARIGFLRPANLTVHALALKRGSREWEQGYRHIDSAILEHMQAIAGAAARSWGLRPYYMYRQKQMAGKAENIGYARPGQECRYNIAIMEERQSVIGLGAGSSTKVVNPGDFSLRNLQHQTDWRTYALRWPENHAKRVAEFGLLSENRRQTYF